MGSEPSDPTVVQSLAVTASDLVAALETNQTTDRSAVLRVTPPFSGRMRARLHVEQGGDYGTDPSPLHLDPAVLLSADAPAYPHPDDTEDELRADPDETYTVERHRERHERAIEAWRSDVRAAVRATATLETRAGPVDVEVHVLED